MINFKKILSSEVIEKKINPLEIYDDNDRRSITGPLRHSQESILKRWYEEYKDNRDLIIKLNTGEGKTLIGLLILQSRINMSSLPCIYICPNKYLVQQVCEEAQKFGVPYCCLSDERELPNEFLKGEKILITHAQKIFNGMSIFGKGNKFVSVDTIVLDDAHSCLEVLKEAFTIKISRDKNESLYKRILELFEEDLIEQGEGSYIDIKDYNYESLMLVPFWAWNSKKSETLKLLSDNKENDEIKFVWPLFKNSINEYNCYISGSLIEISPNSINIEYFKTFKEANHKVLMSATTQDDSFLIKDLGFSVETVKNTLKNENQKSFGEKMIILPPLIDENWNNESIKKMLLEMKTNDYGIVTIVPSTKKAKSYLDIGATLINSQNIYERIEKLKSGEFSDLIVINNRYDGIDLPDESCRILIMDSMPYCDNLSDRYEEDCRPNNEIINRKKAQIIEQGIGRGVRGEKDYCVIIIVGTDIVKFMKSVSTNKFFSTETKKQIEIGIHITNLAKEELKMNNEPMDVMEEVISQCINRDENWKSYYIEQMNEISDTNNFFDDFELLESEKNAEEYFRQNEYKKAADQIQKLIDKLPSENKIERGWYLQQKAKYTYFYNKSEATILQKTAFKQNKSLLKPPTQIEYKKIDDLNKTRINRIREFNNRFISKEELRLLVNEELENLSFGINHEKFEESLKCIGEMLGFVSQRPDKEIRKGPDNLWCAEGNQYFMFECKNEVSLDRNEITKEEAGQMNNHCGWFDEEYGKKTNVIRFLIIPTKELAYEADFTHDVKIIRKNKLKELKENIKKFMQEIIDLGEINDISDEKIQQLLDENRINTKNIVEYSETYFHKKRKNTQK